jgi:hypothetical protein
VFRFYFRSKDRQILVPILTTYEPFNIVQRIVFYRSYTHSRYSTSGACCTTESILSYTIGLSNRFPIISFCMVRSLE